MQPQRDQYYTWQISLWGSEPPYRDITSAANCCLLSKFSLFLTEIGPFFCTGRRQNFAFLSGVLRLARSAAV